MINLGHLTEQVGFNDWICSIPATPHYLSCLALNCIVEPASYLLIWLFPFIPTFLDVWLNCPNMNLLKWYVGVLVPPLLFHFSPGYCTRMKGEADGSDGASSISVRFPTLQLLKMEHSGCVTCPKWLQFLEFMNSVGDCFFGLWRVPGNNDRTLKLQLWVCPSLQLFREAVDDFLLWAPARRWEISKYLIYCDCRSGA